MHHEDWRGATSKRGFREHRRARGCAPVAITSGVGVGSTEKRGAPSNLGSRVLLALLVLAPALTKRLGRQATEDVLKHLVAQAVVLPVAQDTAAATRRRLVGFSLVLVFVLVPVLVVLVCTAASATLVRGCRRIADVQNALALRGEHKVGAEPLEAELRERGPARKAARVENGPRQLGVGPPLGQPRFYDAFVVLPARGRRLRPHTPFGANAKSISGTKANIGEKAQRSD